MCFVMRLLAVGDAFFDTFRWAYARIIFLSLSPAVLVLAVLKDLLFTATHFLLHYSATFVLLHATCLALLWKKRHTVFR